MTITKNGNELKLYLETSVWNFLEAPKSFEKMSLTKLLFNKIHQTIHISEYVSTIVIGEIQRSKLSRKLLLERFLTCYKPIILKASPEFDELADLYIEADILSQKYFTDLYHIAIATVNSMDIVVSWNLRHIVKAKTIRETNTINREMGYDEIKILTPQKVLAHVSRTESNERDSQNP